MRTYVTKIIGLSGICVTGILFLLSISGCEGLSDEPEFQIAGLCTDNYPRVDGSTSTEPLQTLIACKLLGVDYSWVYMNFWKYPYRLMPSCDENPRKGRFITEQIIHNGTHGSFVNLIEGYTDLILTARTASDEELHLADSLGINLTEVQVALDAFVFLTNVNNQVNSLSTDEIRDIYTGGITRWEEVGGTGTDIHPYTRNKNSGSQELMESLVMKDLEMLQLPDMMAFGMLGMINLIEIDRGGLGYSVYYYTKHMVRSDSIQMLSVDGVYPDASSIRKGTYPYTSEVFAVIRSDLDESSTAYQLFELLSGDAGKEVIRESGYLPGG